MFISMNNLENLLCKLKQLEVVAIKFSMTDIMCIHHAGMQKGSFSCLPFFPFQIKRAITQVHHVVAIGCHQQSRIYSKQV